MEFTSIEPFLSYFEKLRARTLRVAACIPPDKIDWAPREGGFTLGDLVRHLGAIERQMYAETVQGNPSRYAGCGPALARSHSEVMQLFDRFHHESLVIFRGLSEEDLQKKCRTPAGAGITVWKWLRLLAEHEIHHRGQIYTYLSLLDVPTPPLYGMTSEQVAATAAADD